MPEMGRPVSPQQSQFNQVTIGPKSLAGKSRSQDEINEAIINKATGYKEKDTRFGDSKTHNQMGKDEFLKLLTFQLQNQDPMNPMEQNKFTGELAQFSQLEQLTNLNKKYDEANKTQQMQDKFYAASFVGKKVVTTGSSLHLKNDGDQGDVLFKLDGDSSKVMVRILDEKNQTMGEIWKEGMSAGAHSLTWDGVALDGSPAVRGNYKIQVKAWDQFGKEVGTRTQATGVVQSVTFEEGEPVLTVDGQKVFLRDVASFHIPENETHRAINSGLSNQTAPMIQSNARPVQQAMNAYKEQQQQMPADAGIYD
ncbi:MAG: flagellar hook assembly protein FlgD [Bacteriovoracaceae bacterium]